MEKKLRIIFFGEDSFSAAVLESLIPHHEVALVVTPYYDSLVYKRLEAICKKADIPLLRTRKINGEDTYQTVKALQPDLCVIAHFERLIKHPLLDVPPMGFINLHPALLPDYRGMAPQHWPLINGEKETGVTVHYVDETADTGDIIIQERISLSPDDYVTDLQKKWLKVYAHIMVEAIERITDSQFQPRKQSHLSGRYYDKLKEEECVIRKDMTPTEAYNLIRGVSMPYFGARYGNVIIWRAHLPGEAELQRLKQTQLAQGVNLDTPQGSVLRLETGDLIIDKYKVI
jgi:methionyl-tRNA formyltransferase